ncbi:PAS domain S-box protein [Phormidium sp. CLA17]|uniref:PAS domain S-box protein n=1 Tax=Leptolyngbya sp. Cla-17 TaxID=2803751 RepID=UPI0014929FF4|nr:PAS domain S-box protein [Leptolyngbya sp. Cla-17]MBM0741912.1 PAS domain S-box protein [Leptolyngbya sp. Cla-17]
MERELAEINLEEGDRRFRSLIENATDIIVILDETGIFRYCSPSAERVLGYRLEDVDGRPAADLVHPEDVAIVMQVLQNAVQNPRVRQATIEYRVRHRDGCWRAFEAVATSLLDDPAIQGVVVNCHDITERNRVEEALRAANRQIVNILESVTDAFVSLDRNWCFTYLNHQAAQLIQRSREELLGQNLWETFPDFIGSILDKECNKALSQTIPVSFEEFYPFLRTWFEVRVFPAADGLSLFLVDVTERRHAQIELLEMSTALGNAVEGIARLDIKGHYIALNRAYAEGLGYEQSEIIGMAWQDTVHAEDVVIAEASYQHMLLHGTAEAEVRAIRKDGSIFYKEFMMVAAYDWYDQLVGHHCFTRDITERKLAEATLLQQAERERLMAGLAQLSASISHRIRQSLNLKEILNTTVSEVRQFLMADRVVIYRGLANGDRIVTAESVQPNYSSILGLVINDTTFGEAPITYRQGHHVVVDDQQHQSAELQAFMKQWQIQSFLAVPILHGNELWGTLVAHQCSTVRFWAAYEVGLLEQLAIQVAIAIQQSELYRQVRQLNANLEEQVRERTTQLQQALTYEAMLKRITDSVRDSLDEDQILQNAVQELVLGLAISGCDAGIYDLEQATSTIRYEYIRFDIPAAKGSTIEMANHVDLYNQLLQAQYFQFCRIGDVGIRPLAGIHAAFVCPIVDDHSVMGDLRLFKQADEAFTDLEIRLVQQVANQCAIAIRQARLYQATQAQVTALEELNHLKDDFLSTVSHELRTPMSNMKMAIHMLKNINSPERQKQYLDILQSECTREIDLINDLLDLQRLEASSYLLNPVEINLQACLIHLVEPFRSRAQERQQNLQIRIPANLSPIIADQQTLERVLAELLNNACKYTPPNGEVILSVEQLEDLSCDRAIDDRTTDIALLFSVANQVEISAAEIPRIFDKFYRVPNGDRWRQGGTGLGLALVQRLVTELGGSIQVESSQGWTTFTLRLNALLDTTFSMSSK